MDTGFDVFERFPDGSVVWRAFVPELLSVSTKLDEMAALSGNRPYEYYAMNIFTHVIVGRVKSAPQSRAAVR